MEARHDSHVAQILAQLEAVSNEYYDFRKLVEFELDVHEKIAFVAQDLRQKLAVAKKEQQMVHGILKHPHLAKEYHAKVKATQAYSEANQLKIAKNLFHISFDLSRGPHPVLIRLP